MPISRFRELIRAGVPNPFPHPEGGGKGGPPPAPDYTGAANAQSAASKEIATQNTWANRPTLNTPWGQQTWEAAAGTDPSTGQPITNWTSNINLTEGQQDALNSQERIQAGRSGAAEQLLGQATGATATPFNWAGLPGAPAGAAQSSDLDAAQSDAFTKMSAMLQPGRAQEQDALNTRLANMGLGLNSEAANRSNSSLAGNWAQQDKGILAQAMAEGRANAGQRFGESSASIDQQAKLRQQAIAEEAQRRGMPLSELNALLTGQQVNMPQMPNFQSAAKGQAPDLLGAATAQGNYGLKAAEMNANSGPDIGSMIGAGASIFAL